MKGRLGIGPTVGFGLAFMVILIGAFAAYVNMWRVHEHASKVAHAHQVKAQLAAVLARITEAETGQRGFLLASDDRSLRLYEAAVAQTREAIEQLARLASDDPTQLERVLRLRRRADSRLDLLAEDVRRHHANDLEPAEWPALLARGKYAMGEVRALIEEMSERENALLAQRDHVARDSYSTALASEAVVVVLSLAVVAFAYALVQRELRARTRTEALVREERERLRTTLTSIGDAVIVTDAAGRVTLLNDQAQALTGWSADASGVQLERIFRVVHEAGRQPAESPVEMALRERTTSTSDNLALLLIAHDGTERPIDECAAPIRDDRGEVLGAVLVFRDVTQRREARRALTERVRQATLGAEVGLALTQDQPLPDALHACAESLVRNLDGASAHVWTVTPLQDGLELQASAGIDACLDGRIPFGQSRIGRIALERRPHLTNNVADDDWITDPGWARREALVGFAGYPLIVDDRLVGVMAIFARHAFSEWALHAMESVARALALGIERHRAEIAVQNANAELEARVHLRTVELRRLNESLEIEVAERRRAEERIQAFALELQRSNRELEQFATIASHDLQEPLRKIQAFSDRLQSRCRDALGDQGRAEIDRIVHAAARMRRLIDDLLAYSRVARRGRRFSQVDLNDATRDVLTDLEERLRLCGGSVELDHLNTIDGDPLQIRQLLQNLIGNALKFHRPDVPPLVTIQTRIDHDEPNGKPVCELIVRDNGIGFDPAYTDRIFNVFERLHGRELYEGTGMGLAICRRIVECHEGSIQALGTPGEGATFIVRLPVNHVERPGSVGPFNTGLGERPTSGEGP